MRRLLLLAALALAACGGGDDDSQPATNEEKMERVFEEVPPDDSGETDAEWCASIYPSHPNCEEAVVKYPNRREAYLTWARECDPSGGVFHCPRSLEEVEQGE